MSSPPRSQTLAALTASPLDLLVIGGGIVGAGVARDAAMRGIRMGLVEQHDFAFGTSSRSSRLLHGGLRYLAQGRVGLVREASREKKILHQIAPHLAEPLAFVFPTYRDHREWKLWQLGIGIKIYDWLCGGKNLGRSSRLNPAEALAWIPELRQENLRGAVRYFDGLTSDARLVLDTLRSAAGHGAVVVNYLKFHDARRTPGLWQCEVTDSLTGLPHKISARAVVNATGPWADGLPHSGVKLRLTKGIHLVAARRKLPVRDAVVMCDGKRILFVIPWGERLILGTTDTDYSGSLEEIFATEEDIRYLLRIANEFFPRVQLVRHDVISTWAGVRPLIAQPDEKPSDISRAHQISRPEENWWDVAGGKLTTYRLMAEQTVDQIVRELRLPLLPCRTAEEPLLKESDVCHSAVLPPDFCRGAVEHFCADEWAVHLDDVMVRRTGWHYYHTDAMQKAETLADWMATILGWQKAEREAELLRYRGLAGSVAAEAPKDCLDMSRSPTEIKSVPAGK